MKPYPWKCRTCRAEAVAPVTVPYETEAEHDGRCYRISLPTLEVLRCSTCGAIVLDDAANRKISEALRAAAGLLRPEEIREHRERLGMTQEQLASYLKVEKPTLARWESGAQIQKRATDLLLRSFFDVPEMRAYLARAVPAPMPVPNAAGQPS